MWKQICLCFYKCTWEGDRGGVEQGGLFTLFNIDRLDETAWSVIKPNIRKWDHRLCVFKSFSREANLLSFEQTHGLLGNTQQLVCDAEVRAADQWYECLLTNTASIKLLSDPLAISLLGVRWESRICVIKCTWPCLLATTSSQSISYPASHQSGHGGLTWKRAPGMYIWDLKGAGSSLTGSGFGSVLMAHSLFLDWAHGGNNLSTDSFPKWSHDHKFWMPCSLPSF